MINNINQFFKNFGKNLVNKKLYFDKQLDQFTIDKIKKYMYIFMPGQNKNDDVLRIKKKFRFIRVCVRL